MIGEGRIERRMSSLSPIPLGANDSRTPGGRPRMAQDYVVRYGRMRFLGEFSGLQGQDHPRGQAVVVRSDRGTELGEVLCPSSERASQFLANPTRGEILRLPTPDDRAEQDRLANAWEGYLATCAELVAK